MESRFGVDFNQIRVHTDSASAQMCKEVGAKANAFGNRIYYGAGYYRSGKTCFLYLPFVDRSGLGCGRDRGRSSWRAGGHIHIDTLVKQYKIKQCRIPGNLQEPRRFYGTPKNTKNLHLESDPKEARIWVDRAAQNRSKESNRGIAARNFG